MNLKLTYESTIQFIKDWFGALAVVIAAVSYIGFTISVPWATAGDLEAVQKEQTEIRRDVKDMTCLTLRVLLRDYQRQRDEADDELRLNPAAVAARRSKVEAEVQIASITAQMRESKCK